jgi:sec-independent protein translocase protein TatA
MIGDILQPTHLVFILVVALLVLGPKRLPEVARSLGNGLRDFKAAISGENHDEDHEPPSILNEHETDVPLETVSETQHAPALNGEHTNSAPAGDPPPSHHEPTPAADPPAPAPTPAVDQSALANTPAGDQPPVAAKPPAAAEPAAPADRAN